MEEYEVMKDLIIPLGRAPHFSAQSGGWFRISSQYFSFRLLMRYLENRHHSLTFFKTSIGNCWKYTWRYWQTNKHWCPSPVIAFFYLFVFYYISMWIVMQKLGAWLMQRYSSSGYVPSLLLSKWCHFFFFSFSFFWR